jgi:hypothetical protein
VYYLWFFVGDCINAETTYFQYEIGKYLNLEILKENRAEYGNRIIATVSQQLTTQLDKVSTYIVLEIIIKVVGSV